MAAISRSRELWPPAVALTAPTSFPINIGGRIAGEVKAPAGVMVKLLRVLGAQVEVEYQNGIHLIPATSTDVLARSNAILKRIQSGTPVPTAIAPIAAAAPMATPVPAPDLTPELIPQRLSVDVVRAKKTRVEGGDYDDKKERVQLKVRLANSDSARSTGKLKGELYIFANSILDRAAVKLIAYESFEVTLAGRNSHELTTKEVVTQYDTTDAKFGFKYDAWLLRLRNSGDKEVLIKSNSPSLARLSAKISGLTVDKSYDRTSFKEKEVPR